MYLLYILSKYILRPRNSLMALREGKGSLDHIYPSLYLSFLYSYNRHPVRYNISFQVIRYQKQLQLNYVSMYKRNKVLENELELLSKKAASDAHNNATASGGGGKAVGHVSSAKAKLFSKFSSKFGDSSS